MRSQLSKEAEVLFTFKLCNRILGVFLVLYVAYRLFLMFIGSIPGSALPDHIKKSFQFWDFIAPFVHYFMYVIILTFLSSMSAKGKISASLIFYLSIFGCGAIIINTVSKFFS